MKTLLITKYKYDFDEVDIIPKELSDLDGEPDYKDLYEQQQAEIIQLKLELEKIAKRKANKFKKIKQSQTDAELEKELNSMLSN